MTQSPGPWSTQTKFVLAAVLGVLAIGTLQLLRLGSRGAEIANVLQIPISLLTLLVALWAIWSSSPEKKTERQPGRRYRIKLSFRPLRSRIAITVAVVILLAIPVVLVWPTVAGRARVWAFGCDHPTELRVLASPDQLEPARRLADRFEQWSADRNFGCPTVNAYAFTASAKAARDAFDVHWLGTSLRDVGPVPDVWLATSVEVERVRNTSVETGLPIVQDDPLARSPVVLGVAEAGIGALGEHPNERSWPDLVNVATELGWGIVRPDPAGTLTGQLGTAVMYGKTAREEQERKIEQRIGRSLDRGSYPLGGDLEILCRYRALKPPNTVAVLTEQALVRFNSADPLGTDCGSDGGDKLLAVYPSDSTAIEYRFVRFGWGGSGQYGEAAAFGRWLAGDEGKEALVGVGLRPPDFAVGHPLSRDNGVRPETIVKHEPIGATALKEIMERYQAAQRRGRVQLAIDGSGSMGTSDGPAGQSRFEVARQGALRALDQMGEADEFGLSIFPTFDTVPVGPLDGQVGGMPRHQATRELLGRVKPGGGTPLFRALVEGVKEVTAVGPSDEAWASSLVVLTDGEDTTSGLTAAQVVDDVRGKGVRVFVIAVGELTCSTVALTEVTTATGGRCVNANPDSIEKELTELFGLLWGVG